VSRTTSSRWAIVARETSRCANRRCRLKYVRATLVVSRTRAACASAFAACACDSADASAAPFLFQKSIS
jgi:hypothetical protein